MIKDSPPPTPVEFSTKHSLVKAPGLAIHAAYGNNAPASPTDLPLRPSRKGAQTVPLPKIPKAPKFQIEYGDTGLYLRRGQKWKFQPHGSERRFSYCKFEMQEPSSHLTNYRKEESSSGKNIKSVLGISKNPYKVERLTSTKMWHQKWDSRTDPRGAGSSLPAYSSLSDPYCAKYCRGLYGMNTFEHEGRAATESDHEFYKRRETQASNSFQRARRRSIELMEAVEGKHDQHTESSRRKSLVEVDPDMLNNAGNPYGHLDAAAAASAWFASQGQAANGVDKPVYRQPTPDFGGKTKQAEGEMEMSERQTTPNFEVQEMIAY